MLTNPHSFEGTAEWWYLPGSHRLDHVRQWRTGEVKRVRNSFRANGVPPELTLDDSPYGVRQWWVTWSDGVWTLRRH